jgi:hypothetical protein
VIGDDAMNLVEQAKTILDTVAVMIKKNNEKLKFNIKKKAVIQKVNADGTVDITINDVVYTNIKKRPELSPVAGDVVWIEIPNNTIKDMYVDLGDKVLLGSGESGGDMLKSVYDPNDDGKVSYADSVPWSGVTDKPSTFPPELHTHEITKDEIEAKLGYIIVKDGTDGAGIINFKTV